MQYSNLNSSYAKSYLFLQTRLVLCLKTEKEKKNSNKMQDAKNKYIEVVQQNLIIVIIIKLTLSEIVI